MTITFQTTSLEVVEEDLSTGEGTVFEVCVEVLSPGELGRPVDIYLSLVGDSAQGELWIHCAWV